MSIDNKQKRLTFINKFILSMAYSFSMIILKNNTQPNGEVKELSDEELASYVVDFIKSLVNSNTLNKLKPEFISKEELIHNLNKYELEFYSRLSKWYSISQKLLKSNNRVNSIYDTLKTIPTPMTTVAPKLSDAFINYKNGLNYQSVTGIDESEI